jgi:hypothetical protein
LTPLMDPIHLNRRSRANPQTVRVGGWSETPRCDPNRRANLKLKLKLRLRLKLTKEFGVRV